MILKNIFSNQSKTITGAAIIIASATFISRLVGLLRDRIFAHYYGAGEIMDAYYAGFKIPDLIYSLLILGALSAGFIPTFTKIFNNNKKEGWKLANNVINIIGITMIIICGLGIIFTPQIAPLIAPGFSSDSLQKVIDFSRIMFLSPIFLGLSMVMGGILQSLRQFLIYSLAPIFYNLGIILGTVVLVRYIGINGIAWGVVLGALMHLILQSIGAYFSGWRPQWYFNLKDKNTKLIGKLMIPRTMGLAISQLNVIALTVLASLLTTGSVAIYNYANNLQGVAVGIIGIPFALAAFPALSQSAAKNDLPEFIKNLISTTRKILFLIIPASVLILLLRAQIVRVVLGSGQFDWTATITTANALAFFALSLFAQALIPLFARAFYSLENTKTPFVTALISEIITIIFALLLMKPLGVSGLALAVSIGATLNMMLLFGTLRKKLGSFHMNEQLFDVYKIIMAGCAMAITIQIAKYPLAEIFNQDYFIGILSQGFFAGILGIVVYLFLCYSLRLPELSEFSQTLRKKWLKIDNLPEEAEEEK